jgi:hypothetical protein
MVFGHTNTELEFYHSSANVATAAVNTEDTSPSFKEVKKRRRIAVSVQMSMKSRI